MKQKHDKLTHVRDNVESVIKKLGRVDIDELSDEDINRLRHAKIGLEEIIDES